MEQVKGIKTYRKIIEGLMEHTKDSWENIIFSTLTKQEVDIPFGDILNSIEGKKIIIYTNEYIYYNMDLDRRLGETFHWIKRNPIVNSKENKWIVNGK